MCGLAGFFGGDAVWADKDTPRLLQQMTSTLRHRGPDSEDYWFDDEHRIALGHRRLSVVDVSAAGSQPMHSHCGRFSIAYNGEIYNAPELREFLDRRRAAIKWRGHSDTEVLLELICEIGLLRALERLDGMFAFALYDRVQHRLSFARDPFGEKPLYYGLANGALLFGSQLSALQVFPGFNPELDLDGVAAFFRHGYVPEPRSIWRGISKLPAASMLTVSPTDLTNGVLPAPAIYWDRIDVALEARDAAFPGDLSAAREELERLLKVSVSRRMLSDVPLGALLSGGIDSSLVTSTMQELSATPVKTFSVGMESGGLDEAPYARAVSEFLGTEHMELMLSPREVQEAIPTLATINDEPFSAGSQLPIYLISRLARRSVTVVLTGDGGDELFAGYNRHFRGAQVWRTLSAFPRPIRTAAGWMLQNAPLDTLDRAATLAGPLAPRDLAFGHAAEKVKKLGALLSARDEAAFLDRLVTTGEVVVDSGSRASLLGANDPRILELPFAERAMLHDTLNYLPGEILMKVDRASMATSLEARAPFLNKDLYAFAWSLPKSMKIHGGSGKRVLRELAYHRMPRRILHRPKAGFRVPIGRWMRGPLRDWVETELDPARLHGFLDANEVRRRCRAHLCGKEDNEAFLWSVLMFQGWQKQYGKARASVPA